MGMLGTVINSLALQSNLKKIGVESRVMTAISINRVAEPYIKNKATNHLEKNRIVIFASGTGNPFFSTDTAAVLRASEMKSDIIFKGTKVDGIYDKDPKNNSDAKKIPNITYSDYLNKDIKVMDATAISLAKDRSLPIIIFSILKSSNMVDIVDGKGSYSIIDMATNESVVPFSAYTTMSCDTTSNYFKQDLNAFEPNRAYKILVKVNHNDGQEIIYDNDFEFILRS